MQFIPKGDVNLIKVFLYPRAIESFWQLLRPRLPLAERKESDEEDKKWSIGKLFSYEALFCSVCITLCVYAFGFEAYALTPSLVKRIEQLASLTEYEKQMFASLRLITEEQIRRKWGARTLRK
mmetsp:Transcript_5599/g.9628  ORF Transcript_5599/g.9628 Transcript_5599/m.9628 type:complete len:123 (-) Transcript_5599:204-572(-)